MTSQGVSEVNTATMINFTLVPICTAVMVQGWRIDRRMKRFRNAPLTEGVASLERATAQARAVLGELKRVLATDGVAEPARSPMPKPCAMSSPTWSASAMPWQTASWPPPKSAAKKTTRKPAAKADTCRDAAGEEKVAAKRTTTRRKPVRKAATRTAKPKVARPRSSLRRWTTASRPPSPPPWPRPRTLGRDRHAPGGPRQSQARRGMTGATANLPAG
jgi:hypothetical protein